MKQENQNIAEAKNMFSEIPVSKIMDYKPICVQANYSIKATIDTFKTHKIGGAPVVDKNRRIIGVISEYDLLLQAAGKDLQSEIEYKTKVFTIMPTTSLKDVLIAFYKHKLKRIPVVDDNKFVVGSVSRIDILAFIAENGSTV